MAHPFSPKPIQRKRCAWSAYCGFVLIIGLPLILIQAGSPAFSAGAEGQPQAGAISPAQADQEARHLEPGKVIERELAGGQSHSYQITLAAGQYLNLVVEQRGIDVVVKLFGVDGKQITEFDSEKRVQGQEVVELVAEAAGNYRLSVQAKQKDAPAGRYEIREFVLRVATEKDRALEESRRLNTELRRLYSLGKYDEALSPAERALEIREKALGADHIDVAASLNNLANLYYGKGDYAKAEPLYLRSLSVREKAFGPDHPDVAASLNNLANLYSDKGDFAKAEQLYQRALLIWEKALGPDHPDVAASLNNLAVLYKDKGDYVKAEPLYQRALSIKEKALGPDHPLVASSLNNLAFLYNTKGDYAKAEPLYQRALSIKEKALGPNHSDVARSLNNLALLYYNKGDYAKAEPLYQRALSIKEKALGPDHPLVASSLNNLALIYFYKGDYTKAEPLYQRALLIREKALGLDHPFVVSTLNNLALLHRVRGEIDQAVKLQTRANEVSERNLSRNLIAGSERQKLAYLALFTAKTNATLSLHSQSAPDDPQALNLTFTTVLRRKGRGLDAMTDTIVALRRHATPQDQALFDQLTEVRSQLAVLTFREPDPAKPDTYRARLKPLEEQLEKLEAELSARSAEFRAQSQPVTLAAVQAALPADSALIEFTIYTPLEPQSEKSKPQRYLAYALTAQGQPKYADLGEAAPIDRAIDALRKAMRDPKRADVKRLARTLDDKVMRPVRSLLGQTRHLLIAPDGALNLIPFAALVDERNQYLVERYAINYLTSGRDLLRLQTPQQSKSDTLVVAHPAFGRIDPARIPFQPLPATQDEVLAIKKVLPEAVLLREQATEAALKQAKSPRILHVATHGFFLSDQQETPPAETRGILGEDPLRMSESRLSKWAANIKDPLLRSGLALTGANQGKSGDDDGLLTALEAAGMDLWGTKLVVLSACDTGVGEVKNGEGVQGLRRALVLAGSESQVMSLWPVSNEATRDLMIAYYRMLQQGEGRGAALRQIQLRLLRSKDRRHPFYWAAFIQSGEWANLEGKR